MNFLVKTALVLRQGYFRCLFFSSHAIVRKRNRQQSNQFRKLSKIFADTYNDLPKKIAPHFVNNHWMNYNQKIADVLLPIPSQHFLRNPVITYTMFTSSGGSSLYQQQKYLETRMPKSSLKKILHEDYIGDPLIQNRNYQTSHNTMQLVSIIEKYKEAIGMSLGNFDTIVEWGGGYGALGKIIKKFYAQKCTYIIIDTPIVCTMQWIYLASTLGEKNVVLFNKKKKIIKKKINIIPLSLIDDIDIKGDLLISTWALSESTKFSQEYVKKRKWFGAKHFLFAYQKSNRNLRDADNLGVLAKKEKCIILPIEELPNNNFAFK
jgi:putative sugar O-methyltransferase